MKNWRFPTNILVYFENGTVQDTAMVKMEDE